MGLGTAIVADAPCPYPKKFWLHEEVIGHPRTLQSTFDPEGQVSSACYGQIGKRNPGLLIAVGYPWHRDI